MDQLGDFLDDWKELMLVERSVVSMARSKALQLAD